MRGVIAAFLAGAEQPAMAKASMKIIGKVSFKICGLAAKIDVVTRINTLTDVFD